MMGLYSSYADDDLDAEVLDLKGKIIALGKADDAGLSVIQGEGRRMEWTRNQGKGVQSLQNLRELLSEAEAEIALRSGNVGGAIGVRF